uniref:NADH dehydrogenase [ubiquinone] 1 beta subcomplex subunit 11, mitochondrial n=1 Tax=Globodera rostochiensis TaxID=31243 RepID=A0A914H0M8_GLORO
MLFSRLFLLRHRRCIGTTPAAHKAPEGSSKQKPLRFSETSAFYGRSEAQQILGKEFYTASYYDSYRFRYIRLGSIFASVIVVIVYLGWFRNPNEIDELWSYDMRLVYIAAKKKILREQMAQAKKDNRSTAGLETELIDLEVNEELIRTEEAKNRKKEERKKATAARAEAKA